MWKPAGIGEHPTDKRKNNMMNLAILLLPVFLTAAHYIFAGTRKSNSGLCCDSDWC